MKREKTCLTSSGSVAVTGGESNSRRCRLRIGAPTPPTRREAMSYTDALNRISQIQTRIADIDGTGPAAPTPPAATAAASTPPATAGTTFADAPAPSQSLPAGAPRLLR